MFVYIYEKMNNAKDTYHWLGSLQNICIHYGKFFMNKLCSDKELLNLTERKKRCWCNWLDWCGTDVHDQIMYIQSTFFLVWSWLLNHKASKLYNLHMNRAALLASQSDQHCWKHWDIKEQRKEAEGYQSSCWWVYVQREEILPVRKNPDGNHNKKL